LDVYLDGGILGLFLFFCVLAAYGWRLIKRSEKGRFQLVGLAVLSAAIVYNLTESAFLRTGPLWFLVLVMIVDMPPRKRDAKYVQEELRNEIGKSRTQAALVTRFDSLALTSVSERRESLP
jgi:O-antigen ligase